MTNCERSLSRGMTEVSARKDITETGWKIRCSVVSLDLQPVVWHHAPFSVQFGWVPAARLRTYGLDPTVAVPSGAGGPQHGPSCSFGTCFVQPDASTQAGKWEKSKFMGVEITGKTLGVIGAGNIGSIVCSRAIGLKMKVAAYDPFLTDERAVELGVEKVELEDAVKAFTRKGAEAVHAEHRVGSIEPGQLADLVALTTDDLETAEVALTILAGEVVYSRSRTVSNVPKTTVCS